MDCPKLNMVDIGRLETPRLILRPFEMADAEAMFANWASDPDVTEFMMWEPHPDVEESRRVIGRWLEGYKKHDNYNWAITLKPLGTPIGSIGFDTHEPATCSFGYCIGKAYWGREITPEAARALIVFMFERIGANRVEASYDIENPNSGRVMVKCCMTYEGTLRQAQFIPKYGIRDKVMYSLLREEYEEIKRGENR